MFLVPLRICMNLNKLFNLLMVSLLQNNHAIFNSFLIYLFSIYLLKYYVLDIVVITGDSAAAGSGSQ